MLISMCILGASYCIFIYSTQARTEFMRNKSRAALGGKTEELSGPGRKDEETSGPSGILEHLNLFPLEESSEKKGNEEYLKEKKDEKVTGLTLIILHYSS